MEENKLRTFITVCEEGSFTRTADLLYLSPVAVKNQIDSLEEELGEKLLYRKPTGCQLTPVGEVFRKQALIILDAIDTAFHEVEKAAISIRGEILAGHNITFNYKFVGSLSTGFSEAYDKIIQFQKYPKEELVDLLIKHQINCIFAESTLCDDPDKYGLEFHPLVALPVYAIMRKGHALSNHENLSIEQLEDQEIYTSSTLGKLALDQLKQVSPEKVFLIEETDRNILFNRIIKGAVELYPRSFSYYCCVPMNIQPVLIGIYTLKNPSQIMKDMLAYTREFINNSGTEIEELM